VDQYPGGDKKRKAPTTKATPEKKKTLGQAPKDPYGSARQSESRKTGDPFRNTNGQMSLFAYFNKTEPTQNSKPLIPDNHQAQNISQGPSMEQPMEVDQEVEGQIDMKKPILRLPSINFSSLFSSSDIEDPCSNVSAAKLRCIVHYFDRVTSESK